MPGLNATSTADISFMLLIFFLMTSSMDSDWGLPRQLPPPDSESQKQEDLIVKQRNALCLNLDAEGQLTCNGEPMSVADLSERVRTFVANADNDPSLPELSEREVHLMGRCLVSDRHVIIIDVDPHATYEAYFQMQNAVVAGYNSLREQLAERRFARPLAKCNAEQLEAIAMVYPQRISERCEERGERREERGERILRDAKNENRGI